MQMASSMRFSVRERWRLATATARSRSPRPFPAASESANLLLTYPLIQADPLLRLVAIAGLSQPHERRECGVHSTGQQQREHEGVLSAGTHTLTAHYSGDSTYAAAYFARG